MVSPSTVNTSPEAAVTRARASRSSRSAPGGACAELTTTWMTLHGLKVTGSSLKPGRVAMKA